MKQIILMIGFLFLTETHASWLPWKGLKAQYKTRGEGALLIKIPFLNQKEDLGHLYFGCVAGDEESTKEIQNDFFDDLKTKVYKANSIKYFSPSLIRFDSFDQCSDFLLAGVYDSKPLLPAHDYYQQNLGIDIDIKNSVIVEKDGTPTVTSLMASDSDYIAPEEFIELHRSGLDPISAKKIKAQKESNLKELKDERSARTKDIQNIFFEVADLSLELYRLLSKEETSLIINLMDDGSSDDHKYQEYLRGNLSLSKEDSKLALFIFGSKASQNYTSGCAQEESSKLCLKIDQINKKNELILEKRKQRSEIEKEIKRIENQ